VNTIDPRAPEVGLLLGYGSIGRLHARALAGLAQRLVIVDSHPSARARAALDHPSAVVHATLAATDSEPGVGPHTLAVIATWGPSHAELFEALAARGVRRLLCEKPLATSVAAADTMVRRADRDGIALTSHHYFRGSGLVAAFQRLARELNLGDPVAVVTNGGAACLVTNGLHWVDLASALFGGGARAVVSTAHDDRINPRSADLGFYGGSAVWDFGDGRELSLTFTNASSVYPMTHVHYRDAVVTLDYDYEVVVYRRDGDDVARSPAVTRTGPARQVAFKGQLPGVLDGPCALQDCLSRLWAGDTSPAPPTAALAALNGTIGALLAAREGRRIALPILPTSPEGREVWPIT